MIDDTDEGVEFSVRLLSRPKEWIPLHFFYKTTSQKMNTRIDHAEIRGYKVTKEFLSNNGIFFNYVGRVCDFNQSDSIQFCWLQTSCSDGMRTKFWLLDKIVINISTSTNGDITILNETFDKKK